MGACVNSLVEKWILHKLNIAAKELNQYLTERNFMFASTSAYNFWLYELCDVYIVRAISAISSLPALSLLVVASVQNYIDVLLFILYRKP